MNFTLPKSLYAFSVWLLLFGGSLTRGMDNNSLNTLPTEIVETVLSCIKKSNPAKAIRYLIQLRQVCKRWQTILSDDTIARTIGIKKYTRKQLLDLITTIIVYDDPLALAWCARTVFPDLCTAIDEQFSFIHVAAVQSSPACMRWLLEQGADPNGLGVTEVTPLALLCCKEFSIKRFLCAQLLLKHNAQVDYADSNATTPLHRAIAGGIFPLVKLLLAHGADCTLEDSNGMSALDMAQVSHCLLTKGLFNEMLERPITITDYTNEQIAAAIMNAYTYDMFDVVIPVCQQNIGNRFTAEQRTNPLLTQALAHPTEPIHYFTYLVFLTLENSTNKKRSKYIAALYQHYIESNNYACAHHILQLITSVPVLNKKQIKKILKTSVTRNECFIHIPNANTLFSLLLTQIRTVTDESYKEYLSIKRELLDRAMTHNNDNAYPFLLDAELLSYLVSPYPIIATKYFDPLLKIKNNQLLHQFLDAICTDNCLGPDDLCNIILGLIQQQDPCLDMTNYKEKIRPLFHKLVGYYYNHTYYVSRVVLCALQHNNHTIIELMLEDKSNYEKMIEIYFKAIALTSTMNPQEDIFFKMLFTETHQSETVKNFCLRQAIKHNVPAYIEFLINHGANPHSIEIRSLPSAFQNWIWNILKNRIDNELQYHQDTLQNLKSYKQLLESQFNNLLKKKQRDENTALFFQYYKKGKWKKAVKVLMTYRPWSGFEAQSDLNSIPQGMKTDLLSHYLQLPIPQKKNLFHYDQMQEDILCLIAAGAKPRLSEFIPYCLRAKNQSILALLLQCNISLTEPYCTTTLSTPLHMIAAENLTYSCNWFIKHCPDMRSAINKQDSQGNTPLHIAAQQLRNNNITPWLFLTLETYGNNDLLVTNNEGKTAFDYLPADIIHILSTRSKSSAVDQSTSSAIKSSLTTNNSLVPTEVVIDQGTIKRIEHSSTLHGTPVPITSYANSTYTSLIQTVQKKSYNALYITAITSVLCALGYHFYNTCPDTTDTDEKEADSTTPNENPHYEHV